MRIVHLSAEFAPIAKAGGLGDVLVGLVRRLTELKHDVTVILPKYDHLPPLNLRKLATFNCTEHGTSYSNTIWSTQVENCHLLLLEPHHPKNYFYRGQIYGEPDDVSRFLYFSKACIEYLKDQKVDVLHLHDWHTSSAAIIAKGIFKRVILTIHNAEYQGRCATWDLDAIGLNGNELLQKIHDDQYPHAISLLKGGIVYANAVNTVSPSYAKEILTPEIGGALCSAFNHYKDKLHGILNGIDQKIWNPATDRSLPFLYSEKEAFKAKELIRNDLRIKFDLGKNARPWIGAITRLAEQKGPELLEEGLYQTLEQGGSFFLLGSSSDLSIQHHFDKLKQKHLGNKNVFFCFEYNEQIAHELYAALDFLLMPSRFEPCGLSQLIAMRYGTIPIVRRTGGLKDTVFDLDDSPNGNGFVFEHSTKSDLSEAIKKAVKLFRKKPEKFQEVIKRIMQQDFSWEKPTQKYLELYKEKNSIVIEN